MLMLATTLVITVVEHTLLSLTLLCVLISSNYLFF